MNVQPDYIFDQIYVYLNRGTAESSEFIKSVEASEGDIFASAVDITEIIEVQFGSFGDIFAAVAAIILAITVIIVILVLYLVIKTAILRRKREFGIQKAIGFTTLQIMNQLAFNFMPIISIGVVLGGIGGFFGLNPVFVAMVSGMGMAKTDFSAPIAWSVMVCAALIILAYGVSMLIAWRIRKISAYSLISE
jgi:putative ABC transport system permease protein